MVTTSLFSLEVRLQGWAKFQQGVQEVLKLEPASLLELRRKEMPGVWLSISKCRETAIPTFRTNRNTPHVVHELNKVPFRALSE